MKFIQPKDAKQLKKISLKVPGPLADKLDALTEQVTAAGFEVDWEGPVVELLRKLVVGVEKDLKELKAA